MSFMEKARKDEKREKGIQQDLSERDFDLEKQASVHSAGGGRAIRRVSSA